MICVEPNHLTARGGRGIESSVEVAHGVGWRRGIPDYALFALLHVHHEKMNGTALGTTSISGTDSDSGLDSDPDMKE
ncbi:hypothetical protein NL676_027862 [Syzygium grande]|nr:hypothetical protein NL676_027862 [Syzygium grande]